MSGGQTANPFLEALKIRRKLAIHIFLGVMLIVAAGTFLTLQYSASAVIALDPQSVLNDGGSRKSPVEIAWSALTDKKIQAIIQQFQLNSGMTRLRAQDQVFTYVRSNILFHLLDSGGNGTPTVQISFVGFGPSTVIQVTNAIAQSLVQPRTAAKQQPLPVTPQNLSEELEKSRNTLQLLSQTQNASIPQDELQKHFKTDADLQAERKETVIELAALDQQKAQAALSASRAKARAEAPPPPNPEAIALEQQIKQAQTHLAELRQRYTDEFPQVQEAEETLADLDGKLSRIPAEKPRPRPAVQATGPTADEIRISEEQDQILARQQGLDEAIKNNRNQAELLRQRISDSKNFAQDYAFEQQRYNTLLQQQKQQSEGNGVEGGAGPRFIVVQSATVATANGIALKPLFWIVSLLFALFVACLFAFAAEQFDPAAGNDVTPRSLHTS